jgi:hypothetical protein
VLAEGGMANRDLKTAMATNDNPRAELRLDFLVDAVSKPTVRGPRQPVAFLLILLSLATLRAQPVAPQCRTEAGRRAERIHGTVKKGETFRYVSPAGWILHLLPDEAGWFLHIYIKGREGDDLARFTPPLHFLNARQIQGWHFRNEDNTGPNDGSVNAPQELREFTFSPEVGRTIDITDSDFRRAVEYVEKVRSFGRGWVFIESYQLTPVRQGERAAFVSLTFSGCLTWPQGFAP